MLNKLEEEAIKSWLFNGYFDGVNLPPYFKGDGFSKIKLQEFIDKDTQPKATEAIDYYVPKGETRLKRHSLIHPYAYWHIASTFFARDFELLRKQISKPTLVENGGIGIGKGSSYNIWKELMENNVLQNSGSYQTLLKLDISNCYPTMYTHAIPWALHGKKFIKNGNRTNLNLLGNRIDKAFSRANWDQTNGLPIGSAVSHLAAEIILKDIDDLLSQKLGGMNFKGFRFRDDYRFLTLSEEGAKKIIGELDRILQTEYGLQLNYAKTEISSDIVSDFARPSIKAIRESNVLYELQRGASKSKIDVEEVLMEIYEKQKITPYRLANTTLEWLVNKEQKMNFTEAKLYRMISITEAILKLNPDAMPQCVSLYEKFIESIDRTDARDRILKHISRNEKTDKMSDHQLIWLHRMLLRFGYEEILDLTHPILTILHTDYEGKDYDLFARLNDTHEDSHIASNFRIIDRDILNSLKGKPIQPSERSSFLSA